MDSIRDSVPDSKSGTEGSGATTKGGPYAGGPKYWDDVAGPYKEGDKTWWKFFCYGGSDAVNSPYKVYIQEPEVPPQQRRATG